MGIMNQWNTGLKHNPHKIVKQKSPGEKPSNVKTLNKT